LEVANRTVLPDLSQKVRPLFLSSALNPNCKICPVERRYIYILETQYTGYNFDKVTLVVSFLKSKILCLIKTMPKELWIIILLSSQSQLDYNYLESY